jgi:hypothetical protein
MHKLMNLNPLPSTSKTEKKAEEGEDRCKACRVYLFQGYRNVHRAAIGGVYGVEDIWRVPEAKYKGT